MNAKNDMYKEYEKKFEELFDELVPASGPAQTIGGEIIRALNRVKYRHYNDGDIVGRGYGKETVNPAVRYLLEKLPRSLCPEVAKMDALLDGEFVTDDEYVTILNELTIGVVSYVEQNDSIKEKNFEDMWDYRQLEDTDDTDCDEEFDDEDF